MEAVMKREMEVIMKREYAAGRIKGMGVSAGKTCGQEKYMARKSRLAVAAIAAAVFICGCGNGTEEGQVSKVLEEETEGTAGQGETAGDKEREGTGEMQRGESSKAEGTDGGNAQASDHGGNTGGDGGQASDGGGRNAGSGQASGGEGDDAGGDGVQTAGRETVNGMVEEVGDKRFTMELIVSSEDEESGLILVSGDPDAERSEVNYTEDTVFTRQVTTDGKTSTVQPGTPEDIKEGALVYVTGIWEGDILQAEEIEVFVDAR